MGACVYFFLSLFGFVFLFGGVTSIFFSLFMFKGVVKDRKKTWNMYVLVVRFIRV